MNKSLILLIQVVALSFEYEVRCPVSVEWHFRGAKFNCSTQKYVCLIISPGQLYKENCDGPDISTSGSKLIFQPFFFNKAACNHNRYQPFAFSTKRNSDCVFQKSRCNEEGQILFTQGSLKDDITCGCNLSSGFRFVTKPKNNCSCIPSEEDCSCYKHSCNSKDNQCQNDHIDVMNKICSDTLTKLFPINDKFKPVLENGLNQTQYMDNHVKGISNKTKPFIFVLAVVSCIAVTFSVCSFIAKTLTITVTAEKDQIHTDYGKIVELTFNINKACVCFVKSVDWYRNGARIECLRNSQKYSLHWKAPILTIKDVDSGDIGNYRCVVNTVFTKYNSKNISLVKGTACKRIKQNFCSLKKTLLSSNIDKVIEETYREDILSNYVYEFIKNIHGLDHQVECFLKRVADTNEDKCAKFLNLITYLDLDTEPGKSIPSEKIDHYQSVTSDGLRQRLEIMKGQLELKNTLGSMIEYDVITTKDHDDIQRHKRLKDKVEAFIDCVFRKEHVDWIPKFLYVLEHKGYSGLANALSGYQPISPVQVSCSPDQTIILDMRVKELPEDTNRCLLENSGHLIAEAVQCVFECPSPDLRQEPIYFFHNISKDNPSCLFAIRQNATGTLSSLVNRMLHSTKVKGSIEEKTFVLLEIDEIDADSFLNQNFGYIERTIKIEYDSVFNEIKSDIIVTTLKEEGKAPEFVQHKSIDIVDSLSRLERIGLFLQFVITRESIMDKIMHLLNDTTRDDERQINSPCSEIPLKRHLIVELNSKDSTKENNVQQHEPSVFYLRLCPNKEIPENKDVKLVAAIDFGTSYFGYAFSTVDAYRADHLNITCNQSFESGRNHKLSSKFPSCILMNKNNELDSIGYKADNKYEVMIEDGKGDDFLFFEQFKSSLYTTKVNPEKMVIQDIKGNPVATKDVFAAVIKALKNDLEQHLTKTYPWYNISDRNNKWVFILPGLWTDSGKELMRKSAEKIGIRGDQLSFVRKSDAASVYYLNKVQLQRQSEDFTNDNKFMIVNIGGGSFDVSAYERINFNQLRTLCSPSGGPYGGTTVNTNILKMLTEIVGPDVMQLLKTEHTVNYMKLKRNIEDAKREKLGHINTKRIYVTFPITIFNDLCKRSKKRTFAQLIEGSKYNNSITITDDKIGILKETMNSFFSSTIQEIKNEIRRIFSTVEGLEETKMLLVGGFADSEIVRDSIRESFPMNELVLSTTSGLIVLMGAVSHGYQPHVLA